MINNTDEAYKNLLRRILEVGKEKGDRTGTGTISIFSHTLEMDMADGFPLLTTKKMFTKGITHELLWFLNGDTNIQYLVKNGVNIWTPDVYKKYVNGQLRKVALPLPIKEFKEEIINNNTFAKQFGELGPIYGKQWVNWNGYDIVSGEEIEDLNEGVNQIEQVIETLMFSPDSRRIIVNAWNVGEIKDMVLPPCHWAFELYTEELTLDERIDIDFNNRRSESESGFVGPRIWASGNDSTTHEDLDGVEIPRRRLSLKWHQRSVDTFLGLPFNIASYGLLLNMLAQQCNMIPDKLVGDLTNVHIYKNHIDQCKEQIDRQSMDLCKLDLEKADDMFSYKFENVKFIDYYSHPPIKGDISV